MRSCYVETPSIVLHGQQTAAELELPATSIVTMIPETQSSAVLRDVPGHSDHSFLPAERPASAAPPPQPAAQPVSAPQSHLPSNLTRLTPVTQHLKGDPFMCVTPALARGLRVPSVLFARCRALCPCPRPPATWRVPHPHAHCPEVPGPSCPWSSQHVQLAHLWAAAASSVTPQLQHCPAAGGHGFS